MLPAAPPTARPDWYTEPDDKAQLMVYLVTAAKLVNEEDLEADPPLRDPAMIGKGEFHAAVVDSLANPVSIGPGRKRSKEVELDTYLGVMEGPAAAGHHHAGLRFHKQKHSYNPFKLALRRRHGIATHWSTTHTEFFSIARYLQKTTDHKPIVDRDPVVWTRDGRKLNMFKECQEPFQVNLWVARREARLSEPISEKKAKKERFTHLDFKALVLKHSLLTPNAVLEYFEENASPEMMLWVSGHQKKLKELIKEALELGAASKKAKLERETEWQLIERLAKDGTCACGSSGCLWWAMAVDFFKNSPGIDRERLAAAIRKVTMFGPSKDCPVPMIIGKKNCAKSTVGDPVLNVFGKEAVHTKPKLGAPNGAYGELAEGGPIRYIYWDDFRPVEYAAIPESNPTVPVMDFLAMFQGQAFKPQVTQTFNNGHPTVIWKKGALMTAKSEGLWDPMRNVTAEEIDHMKARVDIFPATHVVGTKADDFTPSPACPNPWCRWVVSDSIAYASRQGPRSLGGLGKRLQPLALPGLPAEASLGQGGLSEEMKAKIEAKREEAKKRKLDKECGNPAVAQSDDGEAFLHDLADLYAEDVFFAGADMDGHD